jgi:hypothetical protein
MPLLLNLSRLVDMTFDFSSDGLVLHIPPQPQLLSTRRGKCSSMFQELIL